VFKNVYLNICNDELSILMGYYAMGAFVSFKCL